MLHDSLLSYFAILHYIFAQGIFTKLVKMPEGGIIYIPRNNGSAQSYTIIASHDCVFNINALGPTLV